MIKLLNTNSFLNKIAVQEASLGKFICPECSTFFTNSKTEYEDHLREKHVDYDQVSCIYCAVSFDFSKISNHIESHFEENLRSTNVCNLCNNSVKMDSQESVLNHLMSQHNNEMVCPLCKTEYNQFCDLVEHINDNLKIVYHCTFESCQMKTNDNEELNFHKNISGHISDSCFEEHTFNCLFKDEQNQFSFIRKLDSDFPLMEESQLSTRDNENDFSIKNESSEKIKFNFIWKLKCRFEIFSEIYKNLDEKGQMILKKRLDTMETFSVGILLKDDKKFYGCLECNYAPQLSHWDVKKHIMTVHCQISPKDARRGLRIIEFDKQKLKRFGSKTKLKVTTKTVSQKVLTLNNKNKSNSETRELISDKPKFDFMLQLHFVKELFEEYFTDSKSESFKELEAKLNTVDQYSIGVSETNSKKVFYCSACNYCSYYSHCDVRRHILNLHCSISNHDVRKSFQVIQFIDSRSRVKIKYNENKEEKKSFNSNNLNDCKVESLPSNEHKKTTDIRVIENENNDETKSKFTHVLKLFCRMEMFDSIFKGVSERICSDLRRRMGPVDQYWIGVTVDRTKKTYYCLNCDYVSNYSNWDVRKHILKVHCGITNSDSHKCIKMVEFVQEEASSEVVQMLGESLSPIDSECRLETSSTVVEPGMERDTPFLSGEGTLVKLDYIKEEMLSVFPKLKQEVLNDLEKKMNLFKTFSLEVTYIKGVKHFVCIYCGYKSHHNQGDVKKHIMSKHCLIGGQYVRNCMRLCRKELFENNTNHQEKQKPELIVQIEDSIVPSSPVKEVVKRNRKPVLNRLSCPVVMLKTDKEDKPNRNIREEYLKRKSLIHTVDSTLKKPRVSLTSITEEPKKIIIEKQINLRYSDEILRKLCDIECMGHRHPEIKAQMKIYCQNQVLVGRKFNSQIFICSQCNWFTWKSVDVVSSHIIETHAGIDFKLVSLVELSAKMDESGQLLSDYELGQMNWRGKPIWSLNNNSFIDNC